MTENHQEGFERPDLHELRERYHRPSVLTRFGWSIASFFKNRTTIDLFLFLLIVGGLAFGYWALF